MDKKSSPAYTISSRLKQTINKIGPGPMSYRQNMQAIKPSGPNAVIGKAPRLSNKQADGPSPGQYNFQMSIRPKSSCAIFSTYRQTPIKEVSRIPGPGSYQPNYDKVMRKSLSSSKFTKSAKFLSHDESKHVPGPMTYNPKLNFVLNSSPGMKFPHSDRVDELKLKSSIPGPGKYSAELMKLFPSDPAFKFAQQKRQTNKIQKNLPGPLDYKIEGQFEVNLKKSKGFTISEKSHQKIGKIVTPGPNAYDSEKKVCLTRSPAFSISQSDRNMKLSSTSITPGPNKYNSHSSPSKRPVSALFSTARRATEVELDKKKITPGPGAYQRAYEYKTIGMGKKFTIPKSKIEMEKELKTQRRPGPWSYNTVDSLKESLKFGIMGKSRRQNQQKKGLPGPADYEIKDERKHGIIIGRQKRSRQKPQEIPGPNSYIIPSTIGNVPYFERSIKK